LLDPGWRPAGDRGKHFLQYVSTTGNAVRESTLEQVARGEVDVKLPRFFL